MPSLPTSYTTGRVVFSAVVALPDATGTGQLEEFTPSGLIHFTPESALERSETFPAVLVGHTAFAATVRDGVLIDPAGNPGLSVQVGTWRLAFELSGMEVPSAVIEVQGIHTPSAPLDLVAHVELPEPVSAELEEIP